MTAAQGGVTFNREYQELKTRGIENLVFISFARDDPPGELVQRARHVRDTLDSVLQWYVDKPKIFFDDRAVAGGDALEPALAQGICKSVCVVAVCAPIYFERPYCGREWNAMQRLSTERLPPGAVHRPIIPILMRKPEPLPNVLVGGGLKYYDCSRGAVARNYFRSDEFKATAHEIANHIRQLSQALLAAQAQCACDHFELPAQSAFTGYAVHPQPPPFREPGMAAR